MHDLLISIFGIPIVICLLFLVFYIADKIWQAGPLKLKAWWHRHICAPFPYADKCFDCNESTCDNCSINNTTDCPEIKNLEAKRLCNLWDLNGGDN